MFYEEETSPLPGWGRRPDQHLARKASSAFAGFVARPWWQTEHTFGMAHLSELTHCWRGYASLLSNTASRDQGHACPTLLVRNWCCSRNAWDWCFPDRKTCDKKKGNKKKRNEKRFFQSWLYISGQKVNDFWTKKSSSISIWFPFLWAFFEHVEASTSPKLGFAWCTLTSSACAGWHFDAFVCKKQTWKRHSRLTILSRILPTLAV